MAKRPGGAMIHNAAPTRSQYIPLLSKWGELGTKSQLIPMFVTILAVTLMYIYAGSNKTTVIEILSGPDQDIANPEKYWYTSPFILVVAVYLTLLSLYFIYRLVGKRVSWVGLMGCMTFTGLYLWLEGTQRDFLFVYKFFHITLAGGEPDESLPLLTLFWRHYVGTGFFEETVKALPLLVIVFTASRMGPGLRKHFNIEEPLDGIVYGAAAGGGFAVVETVGQYVSRFLVSTWEVLEMNVGHYTLGRGEAIGHMTQADAIELINKGIAHVGTAPAVQLLIPRTLDNAFGHMAYSGYFGYFIGLSVLKPERRWRILMMGLLSASLPHALWDTIPEDQTIIQTLVALLSYALLAAAILKGREISPNRGLLQPSVVFGDFGKSGASPATVAADWAPVPTPPVQPQFTPPPVVAPPVLPLPPPNLPEGTACLRIGPKYLIIVPGLRILDHQAPGLQAAFPGGAVAEVTRNPTDPNILGLTNQSLSPWEVVSTNGTRRTIQTGQTLKLAQGTRINFGPIDGEVR